MTSATVETKSKKSERRSSNVLHRSSKTPWGNPVVYFFSLILVGICVGPVLYMIFGGFRSNSQITLDPSGWPNPWEVSNYITVIQSSVFWQELVNSVIVAVLTMIGVVVLGLMVSFAIARYSMKMSGILYSLFAAGLMFPMTVAITPLYLLLKDFGLVNNLAGLILAQIAFGLPQTVIILVPFLKAIPKELEEAASLDGASRLGFFWRMVIPLSMPGVATTGILTIIGSWNNYMLPLFIFNDKSLYTLPLGVQEFSTQYSTDTASVLAFTSISMIPALLFFTIFQKRIVGGLTGAVKG